MQNSYPAQLQAYLGDGYQVVNFGVSGATLLGKGDRPYTLTDEYARPQAFNPDIVLIKLGTNDSKPRNIQFVDDFAADGKALVESYKSLGSHPRVILLTPVKCCNPMVYDIDSAAVMDSLAGDLQWESAGISGDRTQHLLWRLRNYDYNVCRPGCVVIAVGINNLIGGDTPDDTSEGIIRVAEEAEKVFPDSRIILLGLYPAGKEQHSAIRTKCDSVHCQLGAHNFARTLYVDPTAWFTDRNGDMCDGLYSGDSVHFTPEGYRVAAEHILRLLRSSE